MRASIIYPLDGGGTLYKLIIMIRHHLDRKERTGVIFPGISLIANILLSAGKDGELSL